MVRTSSKSPCVPCTCTLTSVSEITGLNATVKLAERSSVDSLLVAVTGTCALVALTTVQCEGVTALRQQRKPTLGNFATLAFGHKVKSKPQAMPAELLLYAPPRTGMM